MAEALEIAGGDGGPVHLDIDVDVVRPFGRARLPRLRARADSRRGSCGRSCARAASDARVRSADLVEIDATADAPDGRTVRLAALCVLEFAAGVLART